MAARGLFYPTNPQKYVGNASKIVFRSSWEIRFFTWLDSNESVLRWGSEELYIPYVSPLDGKVHRYFPDIIVIYKHKDGNLRKEIVEIKPFKETVQTPRSTPRDLQALAVNKAKWEAATKYAAQHAAGFRVVTEKTLFKGTAARKAPAVGRAV
jgi:TnsA endonuclease N terminal